MRLKIIALICLLTIAVPVQAEDPEPVLPPFPEDPRDVGAIREYLMDIAEEYYLCVEPIGLPTGYDNVAAIREFTSKLTKDISDRHESTLQLRTIDSTFDASGIQFTIIWNTDDVVLCEL